MLDRAAFAILALFSASMAYEASGRQVEAGLAVLLGLLAVALAARAP